VRADSVARARQDSINRAQPGYVVDSVHPPEEELRRFRVAVGGVPAKSFSGGSESREILVKRFLDAISTRDTADLRKMVLSPREFVDLYYPDSPNAHPPLYQSPSLEWGLIQNPSASGLNQLLRKFGGQRPRYAGHVCDQKVLHEGKVTRHQGCLVRLIGERGDTTNRLMFGSIVERDGQFKFLSYSNRL
jgi:hypothetical protein